MPPRLRHRHERARYYAQRLEETITSRFCRVFCSIFLGLLLIAALVVFILWLSLRPHRPRFHVTAFNVTGLSQDGAATGDVSFDVSLRNPNHNIGIYYDDAMRGTLFYRDAPVGPAAGLLPPFYQPPKNTTEIKGEMTVAADGGVWGQVRAEAAARGQVWFRLALVVTIRFRVSMWDTHQHLMHADCDVGVAPDGSILAAAKDRRCSLYFV